MVQSNLELQPKQICHQHDSYLPPQIPYILDLWCISIHKLNYWLVGYHMQISHTGKYYHQNDTQLPLLKKLLWEIMGHKQYVLQIAAASQHIKFDVLLDFNIFTQRSFRFTYAEIPKFKKKNPQFNVTWFRMFLTLWSNIWIVSSLIIGRWCAGNIRHRSKLRSTIDARRQLNKNKYR